MLHGGSGFGHKTEKERDRTMGLILDKYSDSILDETEKTNYYFYRGGVQLSRWTSNGILLYSMYKFFSLRNSDNHFRR